MIIKSCQRRLGSFFTALSTYCVFFLTALAAGISSIDDIQGIWRANVVLPGGIRVQSCKVVNQRGDYIEYLTNDFAGQQRTATLAGTLCLSNGWLIDTITNDFYGNTVVPRLGDVWKVVGFSPPHLSLVGTNGSSRIDYLRDSNNSHTMTFVREGIESKPPQSSAALEKAKKIKLSTVKFDSLPLAVAITMLQDESVKRDADRKGVTISLGPDAKQLADAEINLELGDVTLAETLGRVADSVGLEVQATDTELLLVRKKAKQ